MMSLGAVQNLLIVASVAIAYRFIRNLIRFLRTRYFLALYEKCLADQSPEMVQHQDEVVRLFEIAGVEDSTVHHVQSLGGYNAAASRVSVFKNLTVPREDIAGIVMKCFHRALGIYWKRMWSTFNPFFWIDLALNLPREVFSYMGTSPEGAVVKVVQLIYWALGILATFLLAVYPAEIKALIVKLLGH